MESEISNVTNHPFLDESLTEKITEKIRDNLEVSLKKNLKKSLQIELFSTELSDNISNENSLGEISNDNISNSSSENNSLDNEDSYFSLEKSTERNESDERNWVKEKNNPYKRITRRIDHTKIRNTHKKDLDVNISVVRDLNVVKDVPVRAGAIIYTKYKNVTYFCLGVDTQSGNLTDFGGGVKKTETIIEGGLRELEEESLGVFEHIEPYEIEDNLVFHTYNMAIMFIRLEINPRELSEKFRRRIRESEKIQRGLNEPEVCDIVWLNTEEFLESIHGRGKKLYIRVRKLLNKVTPTIAEL